MSERIYHVIDRKGELVTDEGQTEKDAYESLRYFSQEQGMRGLKVVRRDELSAEQQARLKAYEDRLAALTAKMRGKRVA